MALMMWLPVMVQSLLHGGDPTELAARLHSTGHNGSTTTAPPPPPPAAGGKHNSESRIETGTAAVLLTAVPFTAAAVATALIGRHAERTGESLLYVAVPGLLGGGSFILFHWLVKMSRTLGFACLVLTMACGYAAAPVALTLVTKLSSGMNATGLALPLFNTVTNLGGFLGPSIMGFTAERFGGFGVATTVLGGSMTLAGILAAVLRCIMMRDPSTRAMVSPGGIGWGSNGDASSSYELVYRRSNSMDLKLSAGGEPVGNNGPAALPRGHQPPAHKGGWVADRSMAAGSSQDEDGVLEAAALLSADSLVKRTASSSSSAAARRGPAVPGLPCIADGVGREVADHDMAETRRLLASSSSFGSKRRGSIKAVPP
jgi:MFS family permease